MISSIHTDASVPLFWRNLLSRALALYRMTRRRRQRQRAAQQLQALDDRLLQDIGITRSEIIAAVCGVHSKPRAKP